MTAEQDYFDGYWLHRVVEGISRVRRRLPRSPRLVAISSMPKSGSTFLSNALSQIVGYRHGYAGYSYANIEQEVYLPKLVDMLGRGVVVQQHFKANEANLRLLNSCGIRPIVQTRNVFDVLVSLRDHLLTEPLDSIPALYPPANFRDLGESDQYNFLVDYATPWLVSYYVSWKQAAASGAWADPLWVNYDRDAQDWVATLRRVLDHQGFDVAEESIVATVDGLSGRRDFRTRLNVGVVGRGYERLTPEQRARGRQIASTYTGFDLAPIGLDAEDQAT